MQVSRQALFRPKRAPPLFRDSNVFANGGSLEGASNFSVTQVARLMAEKPLWEAAITTAKSASVSVDRLIPNRLGHEKAVPTTVFGI